MAKHYAVTITASRTAVKPEMLARRLADLLNRPVSEMEMAISDDTVILQKQLRYSEAIDIQRELNRRKIPTQISAHRELDGQELLLRPDTTEVDDDDGAAEGDEPADSRPEVLAPVEEEDPEVQGQEGSAWEELFPDLAEEPIEVDEEDESESVDDPPSMGSSQPSSSNSAPLVGGASAEKNDPESDDLWATPAPAEDEPAMEQEERSAKREFDAGKIRRAFIGDDEARPPHKPKGFDTRAAHLPILAALLSLIAPGTGQIYNGQPEKAQRYGLTFFLIYPWYDSVRQAFRYGNKVRTYYAPRPKAGVFKSTVGYGLKWWIAMGSIAFITSMTVSMVQEYQEKQKRHRDSLMFQQLVYFGEETVGEGVERGLRASETVDISSEPEDAGIYTMDDSERARRLFILGYHHCMAREFSMCEEVMRKVTTVAPENRDALRLQAWASMQSRGGDQDMEIPEVDGDVPSLSEFEIELATEGTNIEELGEWWDDEGR